MTATIGYYLGKKFNILSENDNFLINMYTENSV